MKHMNKLTSAIRHRDNKYWVPSEGLNDASSGKCGIIMQVPNECLKDSSSGKCGIIIQVPNECLKNSSSGKCGMIMPVFIMFVSTFKVLTWLVDLARC